MSERTAMFIDIEGFGNLFEANTPSDSMWGLTTLMDGVFQIGKASPRLGIPRLFAHHIGDGFVLVDDGGPDNVNRLVGVAVALQQFTLCTARHFCAAGVARGAIADVVGCYPPQVIKARIGDSVARMGEGLMTIFPVMGTAIINTYGIMKRIKGATIALPETAGELEAGILTTTADGLHHVDWVASNSESIRAAREVLGIQGADRATLNRVFREAVIRNKCSEEWVARTKRFTSLG